MTGNKSDYRFPNYFSELNLFIEKENLNKNIFYLGVVPLNDVFSFIKNSIAVINPSFFEGWGNTLEHAINLKKTAIVSNIDVHRERISKNKLLFNPTDSNQLSKIMIKVMNKKIKLPKDNNFASDKFIKNYTTIIKNTIKI